MVQSRMQAEHTVRTGHRNCGRQLQSVLEVCEEEQTDLLLIAGDIFHGQPLRRELKELNYYFAELTHTKVVLIAGNHDYIRKDSYYRTFQWNENVIPLFGRELEYVEFPELRTAVYGLSYYSRRSESLCMNRRLREESRSMRFFSPMVEMRSIVRSG